MSAALSFDLLKPTLFSRSTESLMNYNGARRSIFYIANNGLGDLFFKEYEFSEKYEKIIIDEFSLFKNKNLLLFLLDITLTLICVLVSIPVTLKIS